VAGCPAVALSDLDRPEGYRAAKRILDVVVSAALLVLLAPLLARDCRYGSIHFA
jgi:lipopolysaccharide/colanic/teichoic acid biosynthesis glycosyltransferase